MQWVRISASAEVSKAIEALTSPFVHTAVVTSSPASTHSHEDGDQREQVFNLFIRELETCPFRASLLADWTGYELLVKPHQLEP
jgi:hypothetical protein